MLVLCLSAMGEFYNQQVIDADFILFDNKGVTEVWSTKSTLQLPTLLPVHVLLFCRVSSLGAA